MAKVTFNIPDISCGHCEQTIIKALQPLDGVRKVTVDIPSKQAEVDYDDTRITVERMKEVLTGADYPAISVQLRNLNTATYKSFKIVNLSQSKSAIPR